jgi:hypothetical protein
MINPFKEIDWSPDRAKRRTFAISLMIGFPVIAALGFLMAWWRGGSLPAPAGYLWLAGGGVAAGALFYAVPAIVRPFYVAWYFLAACIGIVVANVLMAVIYFGVVTPFGMIARSTRGLTLKKSLDRGRKSYWIDAERQVPPERYYRQF